jgi:hypothetical protein
VQLAQSVELVSLPDLRVERVATVVLDDATRGDLAPENPAHAINADAGDRGRTFADLLKSQSGPLDLHGSESTTETTRLA